MGFKTTLNLSLLLFLFFCSSFLMGQTSKTIVVQPFFNSQKSISFQFLYKIEAEGEMAMGKTILENNFTVEKVNQNQDTVLISIKADSTTCSNPEFLADGEGAILYALLGVDLNVKILSDGTYLETINKEEVQEEFKAGLTSMSQQSREMLLNNMLNEDEKMLYSKIYEINYSNIFKHCGTQFEIPNFNEKDSIIEASNERPKTTVKTINKVDEASSLIKVTSDITMQADSFSQENGEMTYTTEPSTSTVNEITTIDKNGLLTSFEQSSISKMNGMKILIGEKVINSSGPFTQIFKTQLKLIE